MKGIESFKDVVYVRNIPDGTAAGRLTMLAYGYESIFNLLYDKKDGAPYAVIYTNKPDDITREIKEHKFFEKYRDSFEIHVTNNRHFKEEV